MAAAAWAYPWLHPWLHPWSGHPLFARVAQAVFVSAVALAVALAARRQGIFLVGQTLVALGRGFVQIVLVGLVLVVLLDKPPVVCVPVLAFMILVAGAIAGRRARGTPGAFAAALCGIAVGSAVVIALMALIRAVQFDVKEMVPVGSMLIANTMNTAAQALERFRSDVAAHVGPVEAALALGAEPSGTVTPYVRAAAESSMIPRVDNLASLGIVWIPGLMAGMLVQHGDPREAAIYNFSVIAMIFASSGIAAAVTLAVVRTRAFSQAGQLLIRPPEAGKPKPRR